MIWHDLLHAEPDLQGSLEQKARWVATRLCPDWDVIYLVNTSYPSISIESKASDYQYGLGCVQPSNLSFYGCEGAPKGCRYDMTWAEVEQMALDNGLSFR